ncbi:uracil-DNA glycosylase [Granulicoccus phenolivorans]|uniref:uracil-DNA glycosylase n=1 Tax=Granulicoccus phenolivorans TaxID=266854 RepID=UPI001B7FD7DC|nr:uracil-DNA glycosylase [Granulicoccus phenolivorans]
MDFPSPVPPGAGWPGDPATARTPVAHNAAEVARLAAAADTLAEFDARVSVCRACPRLVAWREQVAVEKRAAFADQPYWGRPVPSFGDPDPWLLILGLAPAAHGGNRTGRMFTGDKSGDWLFASLYRTGYAEQPTATAADDGQALHGVRMVAPVHCAPPKNAPTPEEKATCGHWLDRELVLLPHVTAIVALGSMAWQTAHATATRMGWSVPRPRVHFTHGAVTEFGTPDGRTIRCLGCYHVSQHNTFTGRLTEAMLDQIFRDARG